MLVGLIPSETCLLDLQKHFSLCPHLVFPLCSHNPGVSLCVLIFFSSKDTSQIELGPTPTHFNLITSLRALSPNTGSFDTLEVKTLTWIWGDYTIKLVNTIWDVQRIQYHKLSDTKIQTGFCAPREKCLNYHSWVNHFNKWSTGEIVWILSSMID